MRTEVLSDTSHREHDDESGRHGEPSHELALELQARVRELKCLYGISGLVERAEGDLDAILQGTVDLLPLSWEQPEVACARIELGGQEYKTENFDERGWPQSVDLRVSGERAGRVEMRILGNQPPHEGQPVPQSEQALLHAVAERLGHVVERVRAQEMLRQRDQELRDRLANLTRVAVMGEMASSIAHEINQPLTAIATYAQACRRLVGSKSIDDSETLNVLLRISEEAIRAGEIVHGLRDLVRKRQTRREECEINGVILDIEPLLQVDARVHDVRLSSALADGLPTILADRVQIQQVIINLVRNAIDAMAETPSDLRQITISTKLTDDGDVEVRVIDNGCGMPDTAGEHVYEAFFTTKDRGTGMGLSVSRTIVTSHGGKIDFSANPGGGTIFHFTVPPASGGVRGG
jgi:C4-dicarboxylate-specific signal transduction histidine kinase